MESQGEHFEILVPKDDYPDYYQKVTEPISLAEIQAKIHKNEYSSLADAEADFMLMCQNAAGYNKPKSQVHSDSMRIRNVVEGFIAEQSNRHVKKEDEIAQANQGRQSSTRNAKNSPATLQQAQTEIIDELLAFTDQDGEPVAHFFINMPSKKLHGDYFRVIKQPISLNLIKKRIALGEYPTWSEFESAVHLIRTNAEEYNDESSGIVADVRKLDTKFHQLLSAAKAKIGNAGGGGSGIKLRLNVRQTQSPPHDPVPTPRGPRIKLNIGSRRDSAADSPSVASPSSPPSSQRVQRFKKKSPINGLRTTRAALADELSPTIESPTVAQPNGNRPVRGKSNTLPSKPPQSSKKEPTPPTPVTSLPTQAASHDQKNLLVLSTSQSPKPGAGNMTPSTQNGRSRSPANDSITLRARSNPRTPQPQVSSPAPNVVMPPPAQRHSATPVPNGHSPAPQFNSSTPAPPTFSQPKPNTGPEEPRYRPDGKDASSAIITSVRLDAALNGVDNKFSQELFADNRKLMTQFSVYLPSEAGVVVFTPVLSAVNLQNRPHRLTVELRVGNNVPRQLHPNSTLQKKKDEHTFEFRPSPVGISTLECTLVTPAIRAAVNGTSNGVNGTTNSTVNGSGGTFGLWDVEKFRIFFSILPA
ncbi:Bromodomain-containing protein [Choiromyces venosus 120613-1]|uniref:Bromodomain-containing protein n=1 Tax=Choiromyces venosus 120613-1 TaxID=1336337 RepID=A0A3N4IW63_9PEZI|nr:Bromodomain-containing protein [Choiromyces venosus 120613-1]